MSHHPPADREEEVRLFEGMLSPQADERILLIEAPGGRGKTTLLNQFARCCGRRGLAAFDLKGQSVGLHEVFYEMCDALSWANFSYLAEAVGRLANVTISRNTLIGQNTIQVALHADDESSRSARRAEVTRAFFEDVRRMSPPPVLLFDTFEQAAPEIGEWFSQIFLPNVQRSPGLVAVVAGRQVPAETIAWRGCLRHLLPIDNHTHWQSYCERTGLLLHVEAIKTICVISAGHPDDIVKYLAVLARQAGR